MLRALGVCSSSRSPVVASGERPRVCPTLRALGVGSSSCCCVGGVPLPRPLELDLALSSEPVCTRPLERDLALPSEPECTRPLERNLELVRLRLLETPSAGCAPVSEPSS